LRGQDSQPHKILAEATTDITWGKMEDEEPDYMSRMIRYQRWGFRSNRLSGILLIKLSFIKKYMDEPKRWFRARLKFGQVKKLC
jgi:hypothetical protein